jgi:hypothetical protein
MAPLQKQIGGIAAGTGSHAHLLVAEMAGKAAPENPAAVMEEVEYRATHISLLMAKMFEEAMKRDEWESDMA